MTWFLKEELYILAFCYSKFLLLDLDLIVFTIFTISLWILNVTSYQSTLKQLFHEFDPNDPEGQLAIVTTRIMQALQSNLDGKSKQYKDPALTQLFLMNNIHYIVRSVRRLDLFPPNIVCKVEILCGSNSILHIVLVGQRQRIC